MPISELMNPDHPTYPSNLTPLDVLRAARREILSSHGPCHASSEWLMHMTARRLIETADAGPALRVRLFEDVMEILGTSHLRDHPYSTELVPENTPGADSARGTGTNG